MAKLHKISWRFRLHFIYYRDSIKGIFYRRNLWNFTFTKFCFRESSPFRQFRLFVTFASFASAKVSQFRRYFAIRKTRCGFWPSFLSPTRQIRFKEDIFKPKCLAFFVDKLRNLYLNSLSMCSQIMTEALSALPPPSFHFYFLPSTFLPVILFILQSYLPLLWDQENATLIKVFGETLNLMRWDFNPTLESVDS